MALVNHRPLTPPRQSVASKPNGSCQARVGFPLNLRQWVAVDSIRPVSPRPTLTPAGRARCLAGALGAIALVVAACGTSTETATNAAGNETMVATADGGQLDLGSFVGRDVVLWFWAPW